MKVVNFLFSVFLSCNAFTKEQQVQLLLPGDEAEGYSISELPIKPSGIWWVIDRVDNSFDLSTKQVILNKYQGCGDAEKRMEDWGGRTVEVPSASNPIALIRGNIKLMPGPLLAVDFKSSEESNSLNVEFIWKEQPASVHYLFEMPKFEKEPQVPGKYRINMYVLGKEFLLYSFDGWDGEGFFAVRWIGDINRDGAPDVLLDTYRKYSWRTTRFFLSQNSKTKLEYFELANFHSYAC